MSTPSNFGPATLDALRTGVVGRSREAELVVAALMSGRHLLMEGPPGTGKSTMLRAVAETTGHSFEFIEGNAELTPARLAGYFDPALVLDRGYSTDIWIDGPLTRALREGSLLYLEEINRIPEETLNLLVTVMSEGELTIPRLGTVSADPSFRLVAAMNPFDSVGTARISGAIYDRVCRISMDYQSAPDEATIAQREVPDVDQQFAERVVELVRATRTHVDVRVGSSVRGAVDLLLLAQQLSELRGLPPSHDDVALDAALTALSGRIRLHDAAGRTPESVITELYRAIMARPEVDDEPATTENGDDSGKAHRPPGAAPTTTAF